MATRVKGHCVFRWKGLFHVACGPRIHMSGLTRSHHDRLIVKTARISHAQYWLSKVLLQPVAAFNNISPGVFNVDFIKIRMRRLWFPMVKP